MSQEIRHIGPVIWDIRSCLGVFGTTGANRGKPGQTGANRAKPGQTGPNRGIFSGQTGASRKSSQGLVVSRSQIRSIFPHNKTATGVKWLEFMFHMLAKLNSLILPVFSVYFAFISYGTVILNIMCECNSLLI